MNKLTKRICVTLGVSFLSFASIPSLPIYKPNIVNAQTAPKGIKLEQRYKKETNSDGSWYTEKNFPATHPWEYKGVSYTYEFTGHVEYEHKKSGGWITYGIYHFA